MNKIIFILLLMFFNSSIKAEVLSARTTAFTMKAKVNSEWSKWITPEVSNLLITIDSDNKVITVHSPKLQMYKVIDCPIPELYISASSFTMFKIVNNIGEVGEFIFLNSENEAPVFIFCFDNKVLMYTINNKV